MTVYPFYAAAAHLKDFYDIVLSDNEFETIGMHAWDQIATRSMRIYKFQGKVKDGIVELPCNVGFIEAVTSNTTDYQRKDNVVSEFYENLETENYIDSRKEGNADILYASGKLINYELGDGVLYVDQPDNAGVNVIYKGEILDEQGLPSLNFKQVEAIAIYCAYVSKNKKAMITQDKSTFEMAMALRREWNRACDNARTPIYLSQNEMNEILDVNSSWDRKRFGVSYKPLK